MEINKRNRTDLKSYFVKNSIPTESNFADLIDGMLNQKDDGIVKLPDNPLSIQASGDSASLQKVINFYQNFNDANPAWMLNLNPRSDPNKPETAKAGFSISDSQGNSRLYIDRNSGNVGIGTIDPKAKLQVVGGAIMPATGNTDASGIMFPKDPFGGGGDAAWIRYHNDRGGEKGTLEIGISNDGDDHIVLNPSGNVGIGVLNPQVKLDVNGGLNVAGNVGIGTSTPQGNLQIIGASQFDSSTILHVTNGATDYGRTNLVLTGRFNSGNDAWWFGTEARNSLVFSMNSKAANVDVGKLGDEKFSIQLEGNSNSLGFLTKELKNTPALVIQQNGNVGITGTLQVPVLRLGDKWRLSAIGDWAANDDWLRLADVNNQSFYGGFAAGRLWTAQGQLAGSDLRLKQNIRNLGKVLDKLLVLRGITFEWKHVGNGTSTQIGLIAQEAENVFPEVVEQGPDGMKCINYNSFIALLIEAIKEQQTTILRLDEEIQALKGLAQAHSA